MKSLASTFEFLNTAPGLLVLTAGVAALLAAARLPLRRGRLKRNSGLVLILIGLVLVSLICLFLSFGFRRSGQVPASVIPQIWIAALIACCGYLLVDTLRGRQESDPKPGHVGLTFLFIGLSAVYALCIVLIGFYLATPLFLVSSMLILAYRRWLVVVAVAGGWLLVCYFVFARILFVPLPPGALIELLAR
jgi:hypothetical protein